MKTILLAVLTLALFPILAIAQTAATQIPATQPAPPYLDTSLPLDQRVDDLVSRMTIDEKVAQMQDVAPAIPRLRVPAYNWWNEGLHGVARSGIATVFPQAIGLAATWDTGLLHSVADTISTEARAKFNDAIQRGNTGRYYGLTFWSPNINIFRDPRWGRGQETYGEDPFLTGRLGVAFVTGLQGNDPHYLKTVATPKHYAVHSGPETLRHRFDAEVSLHDFYDTYTPAFRATVVEAHADSVMCAYNAVRGAPACASPLLFDLLRKQWGFQGYVVTDCWAVNDLYQGHGFTMSLDQASALSVKAGADLSCGPQFAVLGRSLADRMLDVADINRAVKRLFEARFRLGLFDPPSQVPWSGLTIAEVDTAKNRELALQTARESIVLLKNATKPHSKSGELTLPLSSGVKSIAVIGPTADSLDALLGNYNGTPSHYSTILAGIRSNFPNAKLSYAVGAPMTETRPLAVPASALRTGATNAQPGLTGEYFGNIRLAGTPIATRLDEHVDFAWDNVAPAPGVPAENYSVRWSGSLVAPASGDYRIGVGCDGGCRLYFNGKLLIDDWSLSPHGERTSSRLVTLEPGHSYPIRMEYFHNSWESGARLLWIPPTLTQDALEAARKSDVVVAVLGITAQLEGEESEASDPEFFGGDRTDLRLPDAQQQLLEALTATGKPLVLVLTNGSALAVNWAQQHASAIVEAWYPGEEGGAAVGEVLCGKYNPAGRLPVTFYKSIGQLPSFTDYSMSGRTYRYMNEAPLYPFGYGLSYSTFSYADASAAPAEADAKANVQVSVRVTNTSGVAGDEVVQLYVSHSEIEGAPLRALAGFQRVHLEPRGSQVVTFTLTPRELSIVDAQGNRLVPSGTVDLWVGGGQPAGKSNPLPASGLALKLKITTSTPLPN